MAVPLPGTVAHRAGRLTFSLSCKSISMDTMASIAFIVHDHLHGFADHQILNPFLADGLLVALRCASSSPIRTCSSGGHSPCGWCRSHRRGRPRSSRRTAWLSADNRPRPCDAPGPFVLRQLLLHPVKEVLGDDGGNAVRHHNVPVGVLPI